jgi:hypothetical protein
MIDMIIVLIMIASIMSPIMRPCISFSYRGLFILEHDRHDHLALSRVRTRGPARTGALASAHTLSVGMIMSIMLISMTKGILPMPPPPGKESLTTCTPGVG